MRKDKLIITVATGAGFQELLSYTGNTLQLYADKIGADFIALTNQTQDWWGLEKFRVYNYAKSYNRTLFLDADVCLTNFTPNIFDIVPEGHVGAHNDWYQVPEYDWIAPERNRMLVSQGVTPYPSTVLLNSGIILCDKQHAGVWSAPTKPFVPTHCAEQFWVEHCIHPYPVYHLPSTLNVCIWMKDFYSLLEKAKIIHLANIPHPLRMQFVKNFSKILYEDRDAIIDKVKQWFIDNKIVVSIHSDDVVL